MSNYFGDGEESVDPTDVPRDRRGLVKDTQGTWPFWAPEMCDESLDGGYSAYAADVWAAGVCLWIFIFGTLPFWGITPEEIFLKVYRDPLPELPSRKSPEMVDLLWAMLTRDPSKRLTFEECEKFPWIQQHSDEHLELSLQASHQRVISTLNDPEELKRALTPGEVVQIAPQLQGRLHKKVLEVRESLNEKRKSDKNLTAKEKMLTYQQSSGSSFLLDTLPNNRETTNLVRRDRLNTFRLTSQYIR